VDLMLSSEYLHEKAEESRHNETIGYIIIGSIFFIGGLLETVITVENPGMVPNNTISSDISPL